MTRIPEKDRDIIEQVIYLPMVLTVLQRDLMIIQNSPFKLRNPYLIWIEQSIQSIRKLKNIYAMKILKLAKCSETRILRCFFLFIRAMKNVTATSTPESETKLKN